MFRHFSKLLLGLCTRKCPCNSRHAHCCSIVFWRSLKSHGCPHLFVAVSSFDPRVTLLAIPILLWYNRGKLRKFLVGSVAFITAFNLPFFFYNNIGFTFLQKRVKGDIVSAMYAYDWLPIAAVATLTVVEVVTFVAVKKRLQFL